MSRIAGWRVRDDRIFAYQSDKKRSTVQEHIYYFPDEAVSDSLTIAHKQKIIIEDDFVSTYKERERGPIEMNGFSVADFFCGAGGMGLGFKQAGFTISGAWDWDPTGPKKGEQPQVMSYRHNVDDNVKQQDIRELTAGGVPPSDVWTYGFPCQDLSVAGKQKGIIVTCTDCETDYDTLVLEKCPSCESTEQRAKTRDLQ